MMTNHMVSNLAYFGGSDMSEMESLRLQMAMDRLSKAMSTLSNVMYKVSGTQDAITRSLK